MDGIIAQVDRICDLADRYDALVLVDDSHATGFIGPTGRGTHEHCGVHGPASTSSSRPSAKLWAGPPAAASPGRREIVEFLRQRSRPYLFSNSLSPAITGATVEVLKILEESTELREKLMANTRLFRAGMEQAGFRIVPGIHPIVPVLFGHLPDDARLSQDFANALLEGGDLRHRLQLSHRPGGQGQDPGPDQRGPLDRTDRVRPGQVPQGRPRARRHPGLRLIPAPGRGYHRRVRRPSASDLAVVSPAPRERPAGPRGGQR